MLKFCRITSAIIATLLLLTSTALAQLLNSLPAALNTAADSRRSSKTLVVVDKLGDTVEFFNVANHQKISSVSMKTHPHEIVITPDARTAYVSIYGDGSYGENDHPGREIAIINLPTMRHAGDISLGTYRAPHGLALDSAGLLWVTCDKSAAVIVVNQRERKVVATVFTGTTGTHWLKMLPDGSKAIPRTRTRPTSR
ncbi:MAG: YncE family protein [Gammaproteobacteria bacterium]